MTTIFERVNTALSTLSPAIPFGMKPYKDLGAALPDTFIDYQLVSGFPEQHADNAETERSYTVQVTIWNTGGLVVLPDVNGAMLAQGFQRSAERPLPQDPQTGHYGLARDYTYLESQ